MSDSTYNIRRLEKIQRKQHRQQADQAIEAFKSLISKYDPYCDEHPGRTSVQEALSAKQVKVKRVLINLLQSSLLPLLHQQFTTLSLSLPPFDFSEEPVSQLKYILQIHSELDNTLDQIVSVISAVCPDPLYASNRTDDQHLNEFKSYRLHGLKKKFHEMMTDEVCQIFHQAVQLIQQTKPSTETPVDQAYTDSLRGCLREETFRTCDSIDSIVNWLRGSELDIAQGPWKDELIEIDKILAELMALINPPIIALQNENQPTTSKLARQPVIHLAKLVIPLFKLSRLFFNKLSRRGMNRNRLPLYTKMCSSQIESLEVSTVNVKCDLADMMRVLKLADTAYGAASSQDFIDVAENLDSRFESTLLLVSLYFLPLIPDSLSFSDHDHFKIWFVDWNTQFTLATNNFKNLAKLFETDLL
ncbi:hypothetical protein KEM48_012320 [Puccinia striiformis f. sp. tritici PST-130]|uniref:Uncharacterized protein n=1 Tax=Puccinia striiformis f. sp. tritici PST-78 TaxID=1165861 RepID=A0A0L0V5C9_9BASI|nr:hypothetical protein KEM48_012320 [Puccinia striiformis f. sp. tritici PST-130]KNE94224.1 hypothetical protein PSTG_12452 [Puccinia striiformis f. sp. tritici PST-78]